SGASNVIAGTTGKAILTFATGIEAVFDVEGASLSLLPQGSISLTTTSPLTKTGPGTLQLGDDTNNNFTFGGTPAALNLNQGVFDIYTGGNSSLSGFTSININGGNLLIHNSSNTARAFSNPIVVNADGTITSDKRAGSTGNVAVHTFGTLTINNGAVLTLAAGSNAGPSPGFIFGATTLNSNGTINTGSTMTVTLGAVGDGGNALGFTKAGIGTLTLGGASANTYTGTTTVSAGTLNLGKTASVNAFGGDLTVNGGAVAYSAAVDNQIPDSAKVTVSSGSIDFGARNETIGSTSTATSGFALSGGSVTLSSGLVQIANSASINGGSVVIASSGNFQLNTNLAFNGGTIDFTYTGATAGGLNLRGGDGTGISYSAAGTTTATISNSGGGADRVSLNTAANATTVFNIADSTSVANEMTISAVITGASGNALNKTGAGQLTLSGNNTYQGATTISDGVLRASSIVVSGGASNLGNATSAVVLGGAATTGTLSYTGNSATYARGFTVSAGGGEVDTTTSGQTLSIGTGNIDNTSNGLLTIGGAGNTTITSVIGSGSGGVTKTGNGIMTLSGASANTYTGATTVKGGTLEAAATNALGSTSAVTVNASSTVLLSGAGNLNRVNDSAGINLNGGTLLKGSSASEGTTSGAGLGTLTLSADSTIDFGAGGTEKVGTLTFAGFAAGSTLLTINNWVGGYDQGSIGSASADHLIFAGDQSANLSRINFTGYSPATQTDLLNGFFEITPTPVPEPSTVFGAVALLGFAGFRERKRIGALSAMLRRKSA
ncbi:MAG: fibronectin-binding autotransporter adhesin, partial [Chthoniobacter sp.]|nr:fibronectin-binding autotransporter adhesin [Chthoniobacter sp.]